MVSNAYGYLKGLFEKKGKPKDNYVLEYKFEGGEKIYLLKLLNYQFNKDKATINGIGASEDHEKFTLIGEADVKNRKFKVNLEFKEKHKAVCNMKLQGVIEISDILKGNWSYNNYGEEFKEQGEVLIRVNYIFDQSLERE